MLLDINSVCKLVWKRIIFFIFKFFFELLIPLEWGKISINQLASLSFLGIISKFQTVMIWGKHAVLDIICSVQYQISYLRSRWGTPSPSTHACHHYSHVVVHASPSGWRLSWLLLCHRWRHRLWFYISCYPVSWDILWQFVTMSAQTHSADTSFLSPLHGSLHI